MSKHEAYNSALSRQHYASKVAGLTAFERHKLFVADYLRFYSRGADGAGPGPGSQAIAPNIRTDYDALKEGHRFIRSAQDDASSGWETRICKKYYDRLFKEYCIADLSRHKESKIGLRWRTQSEVVTGKGQFTCGAKGCEERKDLASFEVNFVYIEAGERKQALVKLRVCPDCAFKLNYKREKAYRKAAAKRRRDEGGEEEGGGNRRLEDVLPGLTEEDIIRAAQHVVAPLQAAPAAGAGGAGDSSGAGASAHASVLPADDSIWEAKPVQEASAEEEFDKYFDEMFL